MIEINWFDIVKIAVSVTIGSFLGTEIAFFQLERKTNLDLSSLSDKIHKISNIMEKGEEFVNSPEFQVYLKILLKALIGGEEKDGENEQGGPDGADRLTDSGEDEERGGRTAGTGGSDGPIRRTWEERHRG